MITKNSLATGLPLYRFTVKTGTAKRRTVSKCNGNISNREKQILVIITKIVKIGTSQVCGFSAILISEVKDSPQIERGQSLVDWGRSHQGRPWFGFEGVLL